MQGYDIDNSKPTHRVVLELGRMYFEGNIIPPSWFDCLRYDADEGQGRPHTNAIIILSEIVYWYRPVELRDEATGRLIGYRKKFKGDRLQRSRRSFEEQFGFTKKQVTDALTFLEKRGIIKKEIVKSIVTEAGQRIGNVMYLEVIPDGIRRITPVVTVTTLEPTGTRVVPTSNSLEPTGATLVPTGKTNTEITTETTYGGARRKNGNAAAVQDPTVQALITKVRLYPSQAKRAVTLQQFSPELIDRLAVLSDRLQGEGKKPGAIIAGFTDVGVLPDDLPPPPKPVVSDEERMKQYLADFNAKPVSPADYRSR